MKTIPFTGELTEEQKKNILFWIEELRSGKFKQGRLQLIDGNCYCCLGVACEINQIRKGLGEYEIKTFIFPHSSSSYLPDDKWMENTFGFSYDQKVVPEFEKHEDEDKVSCTGTLYDLNDFARLSFLQIADVIEACFINRVEIEINASET